MTTEAQRPDPGYEDAEPLGAGAEAQQLGAGGPEAQQLGTGGPEAQQLGTGGPEAQQPGTGYQDAVPLALATDPAWLPLALTRFDEVLCDHAHCEKKAASQAISFCAAWPEKVRLVQSMTRLAHEELTHFRQVYDRIHARGLVLGRDPGDPYAKALRKLVRHQHDDTRLTDLLLICALIEARSHERLALLASGLEDPELRRFYAALAQAEGGHARLFVQLAAEYDQRDEVRRRLLELSALESQIMAGLPVEPRIH